MIIKNQKSNRSLKKYEEEIFQKNILLAKRIINSFEILIIKFYFIQTIKDFI